MITCSYWSLNKQRVSLGVFDKCCLLANFLQENGRYEMIQRSWTIGIVSSILRHSVDQLNLDTKKTQVRICWIYRSHRGQGWLDTHILLRGLLDFKSLIIFFKHSKNVGLAISIRVLIRLNLISSGQFNLISSGQFWWFL